MDLLKNPFYILGATTRDDKHRIMDLTMTRRLFSDSAECEEAEAILKHPIKRISAEIAWLPGVDPERTDEILKRLETPDQNLHGNTGLTHIACANFLVSGLSRLTNLASSNVVEWILAIARASEAINSEAVRATLNEDRSASGFPQIPDLSTIDDEIRKQKNYYRQVITSVLENLSVNERARVLTLAIESSIGNDKTRCPILIEDLVTSYERGIEEFLEKKQKIIEAQDEKIRVMVDAKNPDSALRLIVNQLIQTVKEWDTIAQPIQLSKKSRGERHTASLEIAGRVRTLAVDLFNDYQKLDFSHQIINMLKEVFAEVIEVDELITVDLEALKKQTILARGIEKFEKINTQVEKLKEAADAKRPDTTLAPMVNQLIYTVKTWDTSTQPAEANNTVAIVVRNIALHLWNEHQKLDFAIQITDMLIGVFQGAHEVSTKLLEDRVALYGIEEQRKHRPLPKDDGLSGCLMNRIITYLVVFGIGGILALIGSLMEGC